MPNDDFINKIKDKLFILNLINISRIYDVIDIYMNYSVGFLDINLAERFEKLRKINELNKNSLKELLNYIIYIEDTQKTYSKEDLLNMVESLSYSYKSQDKFVLDTFNYILIDESIITDDQEITDKLNDYIESNSNSYDLVMVTNKKIKRKIKKERSDNLE